MTFEQPAQNNEKTYLVRGSVFVGLWLVCLILMLDRALSLKVNGWSELINFEHIESGELTTLGVLLFLAILFLALGLQNFFLHFRARRREASDDV